MKLRRILQPHVARLLTSAKWTKLQRFKAELARRLSGRRHRVIYFHQVDDPHSALVARKLPELLAAYDIELQPRIVGGPAANTISDKLSVADWALRDTMEIARDYGFPDFMCVDPPSGSSIRSTQSLLAECQNGEEFASRASTLACAFFGDGPMPDKYEPDKYEIEGTGTGPELDRLIRQNEALRERLGHYLSGTFFFGGEWYWGLDRLPYLEERLAGLGLKRTNFASPVVARPVPEAEAEAEAEALIPAPPISNSKRISVEVFFSFRSPYSYLALVELQSIARRWPVDVRLRPVLPMVSRGVPLTPAKRRYILFDVAREAHRLGIPFGRIADPLGRPVENLLALFSLAEASGCAVDFSAAAMKGTWSEGRDFGKTKEIRRLTSRFGLEWSACEAAINGDGWREEVQENAKALASLGLWGVPTFCVGTRTTWGRDRLWLVERWISESMSQIVDSNPAGLM